ncbi:nucleoside triphosphate hydrolase superfamily protein [Thioploca ingrica]|uniref:Nucleoside triphosphate hydrolase superfamily protein n=1 Tax=Thioploca ingrica TaxID=40754 RepID=A0A090AK04_9GAMM|nr:nucleoside triphosphate hydrolase superfamily protein [Thioploca ingrica]
MKEPQKVIFLLSHPRAGTTLTVNLLCTNPEIVGVGEMKVRYYSNNDLNVLRGRVYNKHRKMTITEKFLLDNINVSWFLPNPNILHNKSIFCLFLIREGESTISSLLNPNFPLVKAFPGAKIEDEVAFTYKYYQQRLRDLEKYAQIINDKERAIYISYKQLVYDTQKVFEGLKKFLKTEFSFSENYSPIPIEGVQNVIGSVAGDIYSEKSC